MPNLFGGADTGLIKGGIKAKETKLQQPMIQQQTQQTQINQPEQQKPEDIKRTISINEQRDLLEKGKADGINPEDILKGLEERGYALEGFTEHKMEIAKNTIEQQPKESNLFQRIVGVGKERIGNIKDIVQDKEGLIAPEIQQAIQNGESPLKIASMTMQGMQRSGLWTAGQIAGGASDILFEGLKELVPEHVKKGLKSGLNKIGETKLGQAGLSALANGMDKYEEWKNASPEHMRLSKDIEALINIADFVPIGEGASILKKGAVEALDTGADVIKKLSKLDIRGKGPKVGLDIIKKGGGDNIRQSKGYLMNQITGLDPETRKIAMNNPELLSKAQRGELTVEKKAQDLIEAFDQEKGQLKELGGLYNKVRESGQKVDTSSIRKTGEDILTANDIKVSSDGTLSFAGSVFDDKEQKVIEKARSMMRAKKEMTTSEILNARRKLDKLIDYRSEVTGDAERLVKEMRSELNTIAHNQVPGLKKLDSEFGPIAEDISKLRKDRFNKDGSLKDSAHSKMFNLLTTSNKQRLDRLEKIMPGVEQEIKALKALDDINRATAHKVGTYARGAFIGGGLLSGNPLLIAAGIASNPKVTIEVLKKLGKFKNKKKLIGKIKNDISLNDVEIKEISKMIESKYPVLYRKGKQRVEKIIPNIETNDLGKDVTQKALPNKSIDSFTAEMGGDRNFGSDIASTVNSFGERRLAYVNDGLDLAGVSSIDELPKNLQEQLVAISKKGAMGDVGKTADMVEDWLEKVDKWKLQ